MHIDRRLRIAKTCSKWFGCEAHSSDCGGVVKPTPHKGAKDGTKLTNYFQQVLLVAALADVVADVNPLLQINHVFSKVGRQIRDAFKVMRS